MSTLVKKTYQPFVGIPKATGLQEHFDSVQTHAVIEQTNERSNGLQNINSIEDPPWYRLPCQEFRKGRRGKNFNYTQDAKPLTNQTKPTVQTAKQKYNGLQDFDDIFPKNIHPPNKNKNTVTCLDSDIAKTTETTEAKIEHQEKPQNLFQRNNKFDSRKQIYRQTLNGVPVSSSRLQITKSQTAASSECSQQEKRIETSDSCKSEVPLSESQTSVLSKCPHEKNVETSENETLPDKLSNEENLKISPSSPKDQEKKNIVTESSKNQEKKNTVTKSLKDQEKKNTSIKSLKVQENKNTVKKSLKDQEKKNTGKKEKGSNTEVTEEEKSS